MFGDAEPEDAWHIDDPVADLVHNLERRVAVLGEPVGGNEHELGDRLELVELAVGRLRARRDELDDLTLLRADLVAGDVETVRQLLEGQ